MQRSDQGVRAVEGERGTKDWQGVGIGGGGCRVAAKDADADADAEADADADADAETQTRSVIEAETDPMAGCEERAAADCVCESVCVRERARATLPRAGTSTSRRSCTRCMQCTCAAGCASSRRGALIECVRTCVHPCVRACACVRACVRAYVRASVRACERACVRACVRVSARENVSVCVSVRKYVYVCARAG
eukprot:5469452-Pleurochrysis_carterae.AAC.2